MTMSGSPNRVSPLPEPRDRARGLRDARATDHRRRRPAARGAGGEHDRPGAGAAVEHRRRAPRQRAAGAGGHPRRAPRQLGSRAGRRRTTAPARWSCSRPRGRSPSRASSRSARSASSCSAAKRRGCWARGLRRGACGRGGQHSGRAGARQRDRSHHAGRRSRVGPSSQGCGTTLLAPVAYLGADSVRDASQVRHRPPAASCRTACPASISTSSPAATPTPTTRRATPTTRRCRAT